MIFLQSIAPGKGRSLHVVRDFWLLMLSESRFLELVDGALILDTFSSLMRSLSPKTSCLRDLGVPIDLKLPEVSAAKFQLCECDALSLPHAQQPPLVPAPPVEAESVVPPVQP